MSPKTTEFREWVRRTCFCIVCGAPYPDPHHVRAKGMGGRRDEEAFDVENVVPLCAHHHTGGAGVHTLGRHTFAARFGLDLVAEAIALWARWLRVREGLAW